MMFCRELVKVPIRKIEDNSDEASQPKPNAPSNRSILMSLDDIK